LILLAPCVLSAANAEPATTEHSNPFSGRVNLRMSANDIERMSLQDCDGGGRQINITFMSDV
jgi:hypothetical protein